MDMRRDNIAFWVNSACVWGFCAFILPGYDDMMQSDYNIAFSEKEKSWKSKKLQKNARRLLFRLYYPGDIRKLYAALIFDIQRHL